MLLREYRPGDCREMAALFYDTVHTVNARDYTPEQLDAWADGRVDLDAWDQSFRAHTTLVAVDGGRIVGVRGYGGRRVSGPAVRPQGLAGAGRRHGPVRPAGSRRAGAGGNARIHHGAALF